MHSYTRKGEPRYDANLTTLKKEGLYPSPTTALGIMRSEGLEYWMGGQLAIMRINIAPDVILNPCVNQHRNAQSQ